MATQTSTGGVWADTNFGPFLNATTGRRPRATLHLNPPAAAANRLVCQLTQTGTFVAKVDITEATLLEQLGSGQRSLILVLDVSGSMSSHYERQRQAALNLVRAVQEAQLPQGVCHIIFFSTTVTGQFDAADADAMTKIQGVHMGGGTSFNAPWARIEALVTAKSTTHFDIFFSTDGEDNFASWNPVVQRVKALLTTESHVQPVYFGPAPTPASVRGASVFQQQASTATATNVEMLGHMAVNCTTYHVTTIEALCTFINGAVESLAAELTGTVQLGVDAVASIFNNGERCVGILNQRFAAADLVHGAQVNLVLSTGQVVPLVVDVVARPLTVQEETQCFMQDVASQLLGLRDTITAAYQGNIKAVHQVGLLLQTLRTEQQRLKISDTHPFAVKLTAALRELETITMRFSQQAAPSATAAKFTVQGHNAWAQLSSTIRWQATAEHGAARKVKRADRARQVVANLMATHARVVAADTQKMATLVPALFWDEVPEVAVVIAALSPSFTCVLNKPNMTEPSQVWVYTQEGEREIKITQIAETEAGYQLTLATPVDVDTAVMVRVCVQDTPTDPLTLDTHGWGQVIAILAGPGIAFTVEQLVALDPLTTAAIQNPGATHGAVQCLLSATSFSQCLAEQTQLFRTSMLGVPAVPWQAAARSRVQEEWVQVAKNLFPMMLICGVPTRGTARAIDSFAALAWSLCSEQPLDSEHLATGLLLLPYWFAAASFQRRPSPLSAVEQPLPQTIMEYAPCWNAIVLSNKENGDGVWSNVPMAIMTTLAVHLCRAEPLPWPRLPAVLLETARQGLTHQLAQQDAAWLTLQMAPIIEGLNVVAQLGRAESMPVEEMATRLGPYLKALFQTGTEDAQALETILHNASRLVWSTAAQRLTADHPSVTAARTFLWNLAAKPTQRPAAHLQLPRESWSVLLTTWQRFTALFPTGEVTAATVARANANNGWLRASDALRAHQGPVLPTDVMLLDTVFTPWEMVWLALVLYKTQGQSSRLRELGFLTTPADQVVDAAFVTAWVPDTEASRVARQNARLSYYEGVTGVVCERMMAEELHPLILMGWLKLVVRRITPTEPGYLQLFKQGLTVLRSRLRWLARADTYAAFLTILPAGLVAVDLEILEILTDILHSGFTGWTKKDNETSPVIVQARVDVIPAGLLAVVGVQTVLRACGVADALWDHRLNAPGTSAPIPGSQRFNRHLLTLLKKYNTVDCKRSIDYEDDAAIYLVVEGTAPPEVPSGVQVVYLPRAEVASTLFAAPHLASSLRFIPTSNSLLCDEVCFWNGTIQTFALPVAPSSAKGVTADGKKFGPGVRHWNAQWCSDMRAWRAVTLVKRGAPAAPTDPNPKGTPVTATVTPETLDSIVESVQSLFAGLRSL